MEHCYLYYVINDNIIVPAVHSATTVTDTEAQNLSTTVDSSNIQGKTYGGDCCRYFEGSLLLYYYICDHACRQPFKSHSHSNIIWQWMSHHNLCNNSFNSLLCEKVFQLQTAEIQQCHGL